MSEQAAVALAKSLKRSVIVLTDGVTLAAAERVEGEMRGWRVQPAGALLPIDEPRLVAAQPNGARVYPDGRRVGGPEHTSSADFEGGPVEVGGSAADGRPVVYEGPASREATLMAVERKAPADRPSKRPRVDLARRVAWRQAQARSGGSLVRAARTFTKTVRKLDL